MEALSSWSWRSWSSSLIAIIIHHGHPLHQHRIIITTQQSNNSQSTSQSANQSINTSQNQSISPIIIERQATLINIKQHQSIQSISILSWSKSFIRERPFFANKNVSFAKLSRTPCLSFAEPMVGNHDIQLSRNFREKKCYFRKFGKKTFARVSNITCTAFAIKTPYKDLFRSTTKSISTSLSLSVSISL